MKKVISIISIVLASCLTLCAGVLYTLWELDLLPEKSSTEYGAITTEDAALSLHFIDVGQGDCTLIESEGHYALIDAGEYDKWNIVDYYLSQQGVTSLDFIVCTHPHSDHCGAMAQVIRKYTPEFMLTPDADYQSPAWDYVLDAADERGVDYVIPDLYDTYKIGDATLTILSPAPDAVYADLNNYSLVTKVEYMDSSFLLTGDAESLVENELLRNGCDLSADVLKCGHHGSSSSTCEHFLEAVRPEAAIISCGKYNDYGHPHIEVTGLLNKHNIPVWRTDFDSHIVAVTDGKDIGIYTSEEYTSLELTPDSQIKTGYIGNKSSMIYHLPDCGSVSEMNLRNKVHLHSMEEAEDSGYKPCNNCRPY